jgi:predicted transposase/invertase (TIGR01784 family)
MGIRNKAGKYDLTNDIVFHKMFASPENEIVLKKLIEDYFLIEIHCLKLQNPYNFDTITREYNSEETISYTVVDVLCELSDGRRVTIEMQNLPQDFFLERSLFYASKAFVKGYDRLDRAEKYESLGAVFR